MNSQPPAVPNQLSLEAFDGGIGVLEYDGLTIGYLSFELGTFVTPFAPRQEQQQVWFTIFDSSGEEGGTVDDYPPYLVIQDLLERDEFNLNSSWGPDQPCHFRWLTGQAAETARRLILDTREARCRRQFPDSRLERFRDGLLQIEGSDGLVGYLRTSLGTYRNSLFSRKRIQFVKYELLDASGVPIHRFKEYPILWIAQFIEQGRFNLRWVSQPDALCRVMWLEGDERRTVEMGFSRS